MNRRNFMVAVASGASTAGAGICASPRPAAGLAIDDRAVELPSASGGSRTVQYLGAAVRALIEDAVLTFRATHFGQSRELRIFAVDAKWFPEKEWFWTWLCIVPSPYFGYACYELSFFKHMQESNRQLNPDLLDPQLWLEAIATAEVYIRAQCHGQETLEQVRPADEDQG